MQPIDISSATQLATMLTSIGFAVWYAYHLTTKTIPSMQEAASQERKQALEQAALERTELKVAATAERTQIMDRFDRALDKVVTHCKEEMQAIIATVNK